MATITKNKSGLSNIREQLKSLNNTTIKTGFIGNPKVAKVARIQNYGAVIPVTRKMRLFLGMTYGIWLSKNKTSINIPARPFMDVAIAHNYKKYGTVFKIAYEKTGDIDKALNQLGLFVQGNIQESIAGYYQQWASNSAMTIGLKGKDTPLRNTGNMLKSVSYVIEGN